MRSVLVLVMGSPYNPSDILIVNNAVVKSVYDDVSYAVCNVPPSSGVLEKID